MRDIVVSLQGESCIARFTFDRKSGTLGRPQLIEVTGGPAPLVLKRDGRVLYAGLRTHPGLAAFTVKEGTLEQIDSVRLESDPCFISLDRTEKYLFCTYYDAGMVTTHRLNTDGTIQTDPIQTVKTYPNAHSIWLDRSNSFAFVPHTGPNKIAQFVFDADSGILSPNTSFGAAVPTGVEPRHMAMDPAGEYFYCSNERDNSVTTYQFDTRTGTLAPLETVSTLPAGYLQANSCAQIRISPDGHFLYVSNRGHDSIACFKIDGATGLPEMVGHTPTEKTPRAIFLDGLGQYLITAGFATGNLAVYRVDSRSGQLSPNGTFFAGRSPMWVLAV